MRKMYHMLGRKNFIGFFVLVIFLLFFFTPLVNLIMLAFADNYLYPQLIPTKFSIKWWEYILKQDNLTRAIVLSFIIAVITTLISLLICIPAAYAFARYDFPLRKFFLFSFLISNAFPKIGLYVMIGVVFYKLKLMETLTGVVLIHLINTLMLMTWIPTGAFKSIHRQQEEAARDVGANGIQTFFNITLPMAKPAIITASIFTFLGSLEESQGTLLIGMPKVKTIPVVMYSVIADYPATAGAVLAVILLIPTLILLLSLRKFAGADTMAQGFNIK